MSDEDKLTLSVALLVVAVLFGVVGDDRMGVWSAALGAALALTAVLGRDRGRQ